MLIMTLRDVCKNREINVSATTSNPMSEGDVATRLCPVLQHFFLSVLIYSEHALEQNYCIELL